MSEKPIAVIVEELHETVTCLVLDPSPHAPEIPYALLRDLAPLFEAFGMVMPG